MERIVESVLIRESRVNQNPYSSIFYAEREKIEREGVSQVIEGIKTILKPVNFFFEKFLQAQNYSQTKQSNTTKLSK